MTTSMQSLEGPSIDHAPREAAPATFVSPPPVVQTPENVLARWVIGGVIFSLALVISFVAVAAAGSAVFLSSQVVSGY